MDMTRLVVLGTSCDATWIVTRALRERFGPIPLLLEPRVSRTHLVRQRIRRLGLARVAGQLAFQVGVQPWLTRRAADRIASICGRAGLDRRPVTDDVSALPPVNDPEAQRTLVDLAPRLVILSGTRIVGSETLRATGCPFINLHAGITPFGRGVHGGWWAIADGRPELCGSTVHRVDEGIDSGQALAQVSFHPEPGDDFASLPYRHLETGIPALLMVVESLLADRSVPPILVPPMPSRLRTHPTITQYFLGARRLRALVSRP